MDGDWQRPLNSAIYFFNPLVLCTLTTSAKRPSQGEPPHQEWNRLEQVLFYINPFAQQLQNTKEYQAVQSSVLHKPKTANSVSHKPFSTASSYRVQGPPDLEPGNKKNKSNWWRLTKFSLIHCPACTSMNLRPHRQNNCSPFSYKFVAMFLWAQPELGNRATG